MSRLKKILALFPDPDDSTSFYRGAGPLSAMAKEYGLELKYGGKQLSDYTWSRLIKADLLFVQRPCIRPHVEIIERARVLNIPVVIDYDDLLTEITKDNPAYQAYANMDARQSIHYALKLADLAFFSTTYLAQRMGSVCKRAEVVENAFDFDRFGRMVNMNQAKQKIFLWRGSHSHAEDLRLVADQIIEVANRRPDWQWIFFGYEPPFITERLRTGSWAVSRASMPTEFINQLCGLNHAIQWAALTDRPFNRAKSNIAWIEATAAGAKTIGPNFEEWRRPGVTTYSKLDQLGEALLQESERPAHELIADTAMSRTELRERYSLKAMNAKRYEAMAKLCERF